MAEPKDDLGFVADEELGFEEEATLTALDRLKGVRQPAPAKDPGVLATLGHGLLQGFFKGGSDEAIGGLTRLGVSPGGGAAWRTPEGGTTPLDTGWDVYRAGRDTERETLRGARENRPKTELTAEILGDLGSDLVLRQLGVPGVGGRAYNIATGALSGLLGSEAELTPEKATEKSAAQALAQTGLGGYAGKYGTTLGEVSARMTPAALRAARGWLERRGINLGRRTLMSGSGQLAGTLPVSDEAVREALESGAILPFGTTQGAAQRLEALAEQRGNVYGEILADLERMGVQGPDAEGLARRLMEEGDEALRVAGAKEAVPREYWNNAAAILRKVQEPQAMDALSRLRLAQQGVTPPAAAAMSTDLPLSQAEGLKRTLQGEAKYGRIEDTPINEAKRNVARAVREGIEQKVEEAALAAAPGSDLEAMASAFQPVKERLARTLAASEAADKGAAAAAKRAGLSLTDYLWAAGAGGAGMLGGGSGEGALGAGTALLGHRLLRTRGPSTGAATAYWLSRLANAGANAAAGNPAATRAAESLLASKLLRQQVAPIGEENQSRVNSALSRYLSRLNAPTETP